MTRTRRTPRQAAAAAAPKPFHYTASGLPDVWLLNGFTIEDTPYGKGVSITDADGLHRALAHSIANSGNSMAPEELRFVRKLIGQSQGMLAKWLGVSDQTVARWEKGEVALRPEAERLIRFLILDWLDEEWAVAECLNEMTELDEAQHGPRRLIRERGDWREAA
jgi:DNA-binding transcriptional regulator YiaG